MFDPPVIVVQIGYGIQQHGQYVSKEEIGDEDHAEIPLLLSLGIDTHNIFDSIDFWKDKWNFEDDSEPTEIYKIVFYEDVQEEQHQIQKI